MRQDHDDIEHRQARAVTDDTAAPSGATTWAETPVLVTGAAGFLGRRLCAALRARGARVTGLTRSQEGAVKGEAWAVADVSDVHAVRRVFDGCRPAFVFHLAAHLDPSPDMSTLPEHVRVNTLGTASVIAAALASGSPRLVVTGTAAECGPTPPTPIIDETPSCPITPYGMSKALATRLCLDAFSASRLPVTVARLFMVYGPGQSTRFFVPQLVEAARQGRVLDMTLGRQTRDFIHVDDAVDGLLAIAGADALAGRVVNLCSGVEQSLEEVCRTFERITGRTGLARMGALPYREGEIMRCFGQPRAVREHTGWAPGVSLDRGLTDLWERSAPSP
ncbi:MAG: NAD(P)-dependent oxidoreductase [Proteobacteria bacterium]|nr:NAD(P)-dependent oxidoreductase [Pseudomonadota bacterium]